MSNSLKNLFIFTAGAAIGSFITYTIVKDKFEKIAQEEINSVKEVFGRRIKENKDEEAEKEESDNDEYEEYSEKANIYSTLSNEEDLDRKYERNSNQETTEPIIKGEDPYVIPPEEYGICEGYELISLTYYADGFLADDTDDLVEDITNVVGDDFADHFGEYEDDSVFIRNDRLRADFEILRDLRNYSDVVWRPPHYNN
ncbi:MAG: hypothetical protein ACI4XM_01290 [Candidatus Coprovivens sp.]